MFQTHLDDCVWPYGIGVALSPKTNLHVAEHLGVRLPASPPPLSPRRRRTLRHRGLPKKSAESRPNGRSPKNALEKGEKPTQNCVRKTVGTWSCMTTADRPHVDELQLRHQHCFLHCLNHITVVAQQRARQHPPKNCTWRLSSLLHSWALCVFVSATQ